MTTPAPPASQPPPLDRPQLASRLMLRLDGAMGDPVRARIQAARTLLIRSASAFGLLWLCAVGVAGGFMWDIPNLLASTLLALGLGALVMAGWLAFKAVAGVPRWLRLADAAHWFESVRDQLTPAGCTLRMGHRLPLLVGPDHRPVEIIPIRAAAGFEISTAAPALDGLTLWPSDEVQAVPGYGVQGLIRRAIRELTPARRRALAVMFADGGAIVDGDVLWAPSPAAIKRGALRPILDLIAAEPIDPDAAAAAADGTLHRTEDTVPWRIACLAVRLSPARPDVREHARAAALQDADVSVRLAARVLTDDPGALPIVDRPDETEAVRLACQIALIAPALRLGSPDALAALADRVPGSRRCVLHALRRLEIPPAALEVIIRSWLPTEGPLLAEVADHLARHGTAETLARIEALPHPPPDPLAHANAAIRGRLYPEGAGRLALADPDAGGLALAAGDAGGLSPAGDISHRRAVDR